MNALIRTKAGKNFSTMKIASISSPVPSSGMVKIKMAASRINAVDMDLMKGFPGLTYKNPQIGGVDGSGTITETGPGVSAFKPGDRVFFYRLFTDIGTWAEEITIPQNHIAHIPQNISLVEAGSIALPLLTAYESLMELNPLENQTILINGAGGGVGLQAVQIARYYKIKVIAVASGRDKKLLEDLGVQQFFDYSDGSIYSLLKSRQLDSAIDVIGGKTLEQFLTLNVKTIVSLKYPDISVMHKTGVELNGFLKFILKLMNKKFEKTARKSNIGLLGQVTGANGKNLDAAAKIIEQLQNHKIPAAKMLSFKEIEVSGISDKDLGKVIIF